MSITESYEPSAGPAYAAFSAAGVAMALLDRQGRILATNAALQGLLGHQEPSQDTLAAPRRPPGTRGPARTGANQPPPPGGTIHRARARPADEAPDHPTDFLHGELLDRGAHPLPWTGELPSEEEFRELLCGERNHLRYIRCFQRRDGRAVWARVTVTPIPSAQRQVRHALLVAEDITEQYELAERLDFLRTHDALTRLPNRALFFERLSAALEEWPAERRVGLCYLDLDGFKAVNDTLGHQVGDQLLAAVTERLASCARPKGHLMARLGGDEFAVLIEGSRGTGQATALANELVSALDRPFEIDGQRLTVSASIGVVERPVHGSTITGLMQAADTTLYWAKVDGKARWTLFDPDRNARRLTRQSLSSTLRPALERGEFVIEYQPLVRIGDGALRGVEALVRWRHPEMGLLTPNRFIALAEENGAIVPLGRWVLAQSCRQARQWQLEHPQSPLFISVNVAVRQVWDSDLVKDVAGILAETGLPPDLLQLELTESAVMGSTGRPLQALHALSEMGVRIAIDDFGTGYSNLAYLSRLPVSGLKLDGSFVQAFRAAARPNPADETIVTALVELAHKLGLTVTAECVESAEQAERLRVIGCDTAQGWFYSKAASADRINTMLSSSSLLPTAQTA